MLYSKEQISKAIDDEIIMGDGHVIMDPSFYEGFDVSKLVHSYKSDLSHSKSTIFVDGVPVEELEGVYNLRFLEHIAHHAGVSYESYNGRGTQARAIVRALKEWSNSEDSNDA